MTEVSRTSKEMIATWIAREVGERCPDYSPSCMLCLIWEYFDQTQQWPSFGPRTYADTAGTYSSHEPRSVPGTVLATLRDLRHVAEASGRTVSLSADNILDVLAEIEGRDRRIRKLEAQSSQPPADDVLRKVESFLSSDRIGMVDYMESSQLYKDIRELLQMVRSALTKEAGQ